MGQTISDMYIAIVRNAPEFDPEWYLESYTDVGLSGLSPEEHYLRIGHLLGRDPGPAFSTRDYLERHPVAREEGINPLIHNYAKDDISGAGYGSATIPKRAAKTAAHDRRTCAIFAGFSGDGTVPDYALHYLKGLAEISDHIIVVYDNELDDREAAKLQAYCDQIIVGRHGEYDFGSYKRGLAAARERLDLETFDNILLTNDSCYGPLTSFAPMYEEMCARPVDFWGLTFNTTFQPHIQSFFVCFSRAMFLREEFFAFFESVERKNDVSQVVLTYEVPMTGHFEKMGFTWDTVINTKTYGFERQRRMDANLTVFPIYMAKSGAQLIKVKALKKIATNQDGLQRTLAYMRDTNEVLFDAATRHAKVTENPKLFNVAFSIICPYQNRAHMLEDAIESVLYQNMSNVELVMVDDGSTDGGHDFICEKYADEVSRGIIVPIRIPKKVGVSSARNVGISAAKHRWIGYLDSDNLMAPAYFEHFAAGIFGNPAAKSHYGVMKGLTSHNLVGNRFFSAVDMREANYIDLGGFLHHKSLTWKYGLFDQNLKRLVDWDLILRLTKESPPNRVTEIVGFYDETPTVGGRISTRESFSEARIKIRKAHNMKLAVTTIVPCYNHGATLRTAVLSALSQRGDFDHTIIIHDDCSTDETESVGRELQKAYPDQVRYIRPNSNLGVSRAYQNMFHQVSHREDFVAVLEGDDYWTDPEKLQRQAAFLVDNLDCAMVFSKIRVFNAANGSYRTLKRQEDISGNKVTPADFLAHASHNLIGNFSSCMFRNRELHEMPKEMFAEGARINEIAVAFYFDQFGPIGYIDRAMSTYVQHPAGVWTGSSEVDQLKSSISSRKLALKFAAPKYHAALNTIIAEREQRLAKLLQSSAA